MPLYIILIVLHCRRNKILRRILYRILRVQLLLDNDSRNLVNQILIFQYHLLHLKNRGVRLSYFFGCRLIQLF